MSRHTYARVAGSVFLIVALVHLWRVLNGLAVSFGGWAVPMGLSWAAVIVGGYLAYQGLRKG